MFPSLHINMKGCEGQAWREDRKVIPIHACSVQQTHLGVKAGQNTDKREILNEKYEEKRTCTINKKRKQKERLR